MKKQLYALVLGAALATSSVFAADVRIGTEGAYAPWNYMDDDGKVAGFEIELGNELCKRAGVSCEWVVNEWDSMIPNLVAGNYDVIMAGMSITDERQQTIDFSEDYVPPDPSLFVAAKGTELDFENLTGAKIGAQGATIQSAHLEENFKDGNTLLTFETADQSVADLTAGNIDVLFADGSFLLPIVEGSAGALEVVGPEVMIGGGVGMGMRKEDSDLQKTMGDALAAVKADGTLDKLILEFFERETNYAEQ